MRYDRAHVGLLIKRLQHRHHRELTAALADLDVSLVQWDTLRHLAAHPDASLHDLAVLTFQTDQSFGSLATRMAARGLIERVAAPGRAIRHRLTDRGEHIRAEGQKRLDRIAADSFAALTSAQVDQLGELLTAALSRHADR